MAKVALEVPFRIKENYPEPLKRVWGNVLLSPFDLFLRAQEEAKKNGADFLGIYFNIDDIDEKDECCNFLNKIKDKIAMPLIVRGSSNKTLNNEFIPAIAGCIPKDAIIGHAQDTNYEAVLSATLGHKVILRTPIDINLTKELNILSTDIGVKKEDILIDPETGCVGYGLDYGFSIIERIKEAANTGDDMLDMPIIVFAGEESYKAKEAKSDDFGASWGNLDERCVMWEITTASSLISAGADIVVCWNPITVKTLKMASGVGYGA